MIILALLVTQHDKHLVDRSADFQLSTSYTIAQLRLGQIHTPVLPSLWVHKDLMTSLTTLTQLYIQPYNQVLTLI